MSDVRTVLDALPLRPLHWAPAVRVVPRYPRIEMLEEFDRDLQAAVLAELATVDPDLLGNLRLLPVGPPPAGPGASHIIMSYTFSRPGRFNDYTFAAFYGAESLATAIQETVHHVVASLRDCDAPAQTLPPRLVLHVDVDAHAVVDARASAYAPLHDRDDYTQSQRFGALVRERGHEAIVYESVRRAGGECVAVYEPSTLSRCREDRQLVYRYERGAVHVSEVHYSGGG
jgi:RES domain-containing protein